MAEKLRIGVVTYPGQSAAGFNWPIYSTFFTRLLLPYCASLSAIVADTFRVDDEAIRLIEVPFYENRSHSLFSRLSKYVLPQFRILPKLIKMSKSCDVIIFFEIADLYAMLALIVKVLLRKKVIIVHSGLISRGLEVDYGRGLLKLGKAIRYAIRLLEKVTFSLADRIVVESEAITDQHDLRKYRGKLYAAKSCFVDIDSFKVEKDITARRNVVGYVGRFGEDKGAMNFARAIGKIKEPHDLEFMMVGGLDSNEISQIQGVLKESNPSHKVIVLGNVPHQEVPAYLNKLKLLVLPSYSEGLPRIVLEAMACGTPVLATPVGGIPDVIKDAETGFILENSSPEAIAEGIIRALNHHNLRQIVKDARRLIEREYSFAPTLKRWGVVLSDLSQDD